MIDPIDPTTEGYILDVQRLRKIINDPKYDDSMQILLAVKDVDDGVNINMADLEFVVLGDSDTGKELVILLNTNYFDDKGIYDEKS